MYPKVTFLSLLILSAFTLVWVFNITFASQKDIAAYAQLTKSLHNSVTSKDYSATHQDRKEIRKDIWLAQENNLRLHYRIDSTSSTLTLVPKDNKVEILENLQGIQGWVQERLYTNGSNLMQQMRFFEAAEGTYQYNTQEFLAKSVALSLFRLPGHTLPLSVDIHNAFLKGIAQDVSFAVSGKTPQFQAKQFQATLSNQKMEPQP